MMVVGLKGEGYVGQIGGGCTVNEYSAHFSLWCMLSAPLLLGHDVHKDMPEIDEIVLNRELIAINQDDLGVQAYALPPMSNGYIVLAKPPIGIWETSCTERILTYPHIALSYCVRTGFDETIQKALTGIL